MSKMPIYDTIDAMKSVKRRYPWIPIAVIKRVLFANDCYMEKIGVIDWRPSLRWWYYPYFKKRK